MDSLENIKSNLLTLLGTESKSSWLSFMQFIDDEMPFLATKGRPLMIEIENSIIGASGFKSWESMCDATTSDNGLSWSYNTYRLWKKSWNVVKEHSYLAVLELSASEINSIYLECKKQNVEYPRSPEELESFKKSSKAVKKAKDAVANKDLRKELTKTHAQVQVLSEQVDTMNTVREENGTLKAENAQLAKSLGSVLDKNVTEELTKAHAQVQVLSEQVNTMNTMREDNARLKAENTQLKTENTILDESLSSVSKVKDKAIEEKGKARASLSKYRNATFGKRFSYLFSRAIE